MRAHAFAWSAALVLLGASACNGDDGDGGGSGGISGSGGVGATGGMNVAGMTGGAGAGGGGAGGMGGGGAGGASAMGGTGGGGTGGAAGNGVPGCEAAMPGTPADLHAAALMAFSGGCASSRSCHGMGGMQAGLAFMADSNLNALLVDKPSCQAPSIPLVSAGGDEAALQNSWVWQKLTAPADGSSNLIAKPEWGEPVLTCNQSGGGFGTRMPQGGFELSEERMAAVRNWICGGALAP